MLERFGGHSARVCTILAGLLALPCGAQQVSPSGYARLHGQLQEGAPFDRHYQGVRQQVHDDLRGEELQISRLGVRRLVGGRSTWESRQVDLELAMGPGDFDRFGPDYAQNFSDPSRKQTVMARRWLSLPDWRARLAAPRLDAYLPLDAPYLHDGRSALVWEVRVHDNSARVPGGNHVPIYGVDSFQPFLWSGTYGEPLPRSNTGCEQGQTRQLMFNVRLPVHQWRFRVQYFSTLQGPVSVLVGTQLADLTIPGLCGPLRVGGLLDVVSGHNHVYGGFNSPDYVVPFDPRLVGVSLVSQAIVGNVAIPGSLSVSQGWHTTVTAPPPLPARVSETFSRGSVTATTGLYRKAQGWIVEFR